MLKQFYRRGYIVMLGVAFCFILISCDEEEKQGKPRLEVRITDKPANYEEVNIEIKAIEVHISGNDEKGAWYSLHANTGVFNLLKYTGGKDTLVSSEEIPTGKITQIRLILGSNNSIKTGNVTYPMESPGSELKINVQADIKEGTTYKLLIDFDASRSVNENKKKYILKPVIRAILEAHTGGIKGIINPINSSAAVYSIKGTDTIGTYTDETGRFVIRGLAEGTYKVLVIPTQEQDAIEKKGIVVYTGNITDLEVINLGY